jgi:hypothetical protein
MVERTVEGRPSRAATMLRAALPVIPGVNLVPGVAKHGAENGDALPDLTLHRTDVAVDPDHVAAYAEVCGFAPSQTLPFSYPHMLAFDLHMGIMTDRSFPFPAIGTVHLANAITQHRGIAPSERLDVSATAQGLRAHPKGRVFDLVTSVRSDEETVWESTSTYLRVGRGDDDAPVPPDFELIAGTGATWRLRGDLGRRYAAVSGDHNPIHLYPLTAKAFGFKRQIAHGMWTKARSVATFANRLGDAATVEVQFKKPVFLPGTVAFGSRSFESNHGTGLDFALSDPRSGKPHLLGRARTH